jgi:hypothetical protein
MKIPIQKEFNLVHDYKVTPPTLNFSDNKLEKKIMPYIVVYMVVILVGSLDEKCSEWLDMKLG